MAYEQRDGSGSLFKNEKTKDTQPDYKGTFTLGGVQYGIAGWIRDGQKAKFMSLKVEEKQPRDPGGQGAPATTAATSPIGEESQFAQEDIPF